MVPLHCYLCYFLPFPFKVSKIYGTFHKFIIIFYALILYFLDMVSSQLQLHRYHTGRESRVVTALTLLKSHLFRYIFILRVMPLVVLGVFPFV